MAFALVCAVSTPALAEVPRLGDGHYTCQMRLGSAIVTYGFVDIRGRTYRGPSLGSGGTFATFSLSSTGVIQWSRGFGAVGSNGGQLGTTEVTQTDHFVVHYFTPRGSPNVLDCGRE
jgi:hypothetical protein